MTDNTIKLSPSTISLFMECPRCFWLQFNKNIHRSRDIFPSLPGGMDGVIKINLFTVHPSPFTHPLSGEIGLHLLKNQILI